MWFQRRYRVQPVTSDWTMANRFRETLRGVRTAFTQTIDVSDLLLGELQDKGVLTDEQYDQIWVRIMVIVFSLWITYFYIITSACVFSVTDDHDTRSLSLQRPTFPSTNFFSFRTQLS